MGRTPEQITADEALIEAIGVCRTAYYGAPPEGIISLLTDYIVVYVNQGYANGEEGSGIGWLVRDGLPMYRAVGALRLAETEIATRFIANQMGSADG